MAVYNAVCVSTLLYGCEAWVLYRRHIKTLEQFHISCFQRMLRLRWWDKVPHVEIRHGALCLLMEAIIAERQLRWTGHVIRMPENRLPRRVLYGELKEGRRSVGGQCERFKDCLKATLKKSAIPPDQLETLAADRKGWRDICTTGILFMQATQNKTEDERRR